MNNTKYMLTETLYLTIKVIDRAVLEDPKSYAPFVFGLEKVKNDIREVLDNIEMVVEEEGSKAG
jgi:hypothetical protein